MFMADESSYILLVFLLEKIVSRVCRSIQVRMVERVRRRRKTTHICSDIKKMIK